MAVTITLEEVEEMDANYEGICIACGEIRDSCEPDARNYECEACGERQVFGAMEMATMGLVR